MPISTAPYTRKWEHSKSRGHEHAVTCGYCGRQVPRYKTFVKFKGFRITDPTILQAVDRSMIHTLSHKIYVCPSCARYHKIVERGKTARKSHLH
jgi:small subunit ribosomal protein S26e